MTTDLNTLLTALHVKIDDYLSHRTRPGRPPELVQPAGPFAEQLARATLFAGVGPGGG